MICTVNSCMILVTKLFYIVNMNTNIICIAKLEKFYLSAKKIDKRHKENKKKERKTMYSEQLHVYQQINSSGTAYLLMCLAPNTVNRSFINYFSFFLVIYVAFNN